MAKRYKLPAERHIEKLEDAAEDAFDRGDDRSAVDYLAVAERAGDELEGIDTARRERMKDRAAAHKPQSVSNTREIGAVRRRVRASADGALAAAASELEGYEGRRLPDEKFARFRKRVDSALHALREDDELRKLVKRDKGVRVTREAGPYDKGSPHSWTCDVLAAREPNAQAFVTTRSGENSMSRSAVLRRLDMHGRDIAAAIAKRSKYGRQAEAILAESVRCENAHDHEKRARAAIEAARDFRPPETRAFGTDGGATATAPGEGSALVSPAIVLDCWAKYRNALRQLCHGLHECAVALLRHETVRPAGDYGQHGDIANGGFGSVGILTGGGIERIADRHQGRRREGLAAADRQSWPGNLR